jgi:hypothetical protein
MSRLDVDGRDKPGHDGESLKVLENTVKYRCVDAHSAAPPCSRAKIVPDTRGTRPGMTVKGA